MKKYNVMIALMQGMLACISARNRTTVVLLLGILIFSTCLSCKKSMNDVSGEFYRRPEHLYLGVVDSLKVSPGLNRVKLFWEINADPRITKTVIYWNKRKDSVTVAVNRTEMGRIMATHEIKNLGEQDYIFEFIAKNDKGLSSLPKQLSTSVYGDMYIQMLKNRTIASLTRDEKTGDVLIKWNAIASSIILNTTIKYQENGELRTLIVENTDTQTLLKGVHSGMALTLSSAFLPVGSLDVLNALEDRVILP